LWHRYRSTTLGTYRVDATQLAAAARRVRTACDALDEHDALLGSTRRGCRLGLELNEQVVVFSVTGLRLRGRLLGRAVTGECARSIVKIRSLLRRITREARQSDRVVRRSALASACRHVLMTPAAVYAGYAVYSRAFALSARAVRTKSGATSREASRALVRADAKNQRLPSVKQGLERFRSGCA
jgi:hypothetical protein